jgi:hypothetical protein
MSMMKESEAFRKVCPIFAKLEVHIIDADTPSGIQRNTEVIGGCIGSSCMMWERSRTIKDPSVGDCSLKNLVVG